MVVCYKENFQNGATYSKSFTSLPVLFWPPERMDGWLSCWQLACVSLEIKGQAAFLGVVLWCATKLRNSPPTALPSSRVSTQQGATRLRGEWNNRTRTVKYVKLLVYGFHSELCPTLSSSMSPGHHPSLCSTSQQVNLATPHQQVGSQAFFPVMSVTPRVFSRRLSPRLSHRVKWKMTLHANKLAPSSPSFRRQLRNIDKGLQVTKRMTVSALQEFSPTPAPLTKLLLLIYR